MSKDQLLVPPRLPQPVQNDGVLRFELTDEDIVSLSRPELQAMHDAMERAALAQEAQGVTLLAATWYDVARRVLCIAFTRDPQ